MFYEKIKMFHDAHTQGSSWGRVGFERSWQSWKRCYYIAANFLEDYLEGQSRGWLMQHEDEAMRCRRSRSVEQWQMCVKNICHAVVSVKHAYQYLMWIQGVFVSGVNAVLLWLAWTCWVPPVTFMVKSAWPRHPHYGIAVLVCLNQASLKRR